jgi:hypothetical protein
MKRLVVSEVCRGDWAGEAISLHGDRNKLTELTIFLGKELQLRTQQEKVFANGEVMVVVCGGIEFTGAQREDSTCSNQSLSYTRKQYINASWVFVAYSPLKRLPRYAPAVRATSRSPASSAICFKQKVQIISFQNQGLSNLS